MRFPNLVLAFLVAALVLASGRASAQSFAAAQPNSNSTKTGQLGLARALKFDFARVSSWMASSNSQAGVQRFRDSGQGQQSVYVTALPSKQDVCYSLDVYKFSHEDDQVPRMTGSTTCTPADRFAVKSADIVVTRGSKAGQAPK